MLILSRHTDEALMIGEKITVRILGICGQQVRLGIIAPKDISVYREEIYMKIKAQDVRKQTEPKNKASEGGILVLTRRTSEAIIIGDEIEIRILRVRRQEVRVGITAPESITIHREEVCFID